MRLLISCPDQHGIVAAVSGFLLEQGANIVEADQHATEPEGGTFFMRMAFGLDRLDRDPGGRGAFEQDFADAVAQRFAMDWRIAYPDAPKRVALMAPRGDHCLLDLLWPWRRLRG
jgi:formyltetrahydrofolate deformylase